MYNYIINYLLDKFMIESMFKKFLRQIYLVQMLSL